MNKESSNPQGVEGFKGSYDIGVNKISELSIQLGQGHDVNLPDLARQVYYKFPFLDSGGTLAYFDQIASPAPAMHYQRDCRVPSYVLASILVSNAWEVNLQIAPNLNFLHPIIRVRRQNGQNGQIVSINFHGHSERGGGEDTVTINPTLHFAGPAGLSFGESVPAIMAAQNSYVYYLSKMLQQRTSQLQISYEELNTFAGHICFNSEIGIPYATEVVESAFEQAQRRYNKIRPIR